jgi:TPR repeat protein
MSSDDEKTASLVPSPSHALSRAGSTSLVQRGMQDWLAAEDAEQWLKKGLEFSAQGLHEEAALWYRKAAERGLASAQYSLGSAYELGCGVPQDDHQKALWYRRAAEQGHTTAQIGLGLAYWYGYGVPKDDNQAAAWIRKAAEHGDPGGQFGLALVYLEGKGVPRDSEQAVFWLRKAAEQGDEAAKAALAKLSRRVAFPK